MAAKLHGLNVIRKCHVCLKKFQAKHEHLGRIQKYCGRECWARRAPRHEIICSGCGRKGLNRFGKKYCSRECAFKNRLESSASAWKGKDAGYSAIHKWVYSRFGKPKLCKFCRTNGNGKRMHWANIDHKYMRDKKDWIPLCAKCHSAFDRREKPAKQEVNRNA